MGGGGGGWVVGWGCGLFVLDCALRVLIGWPGKLQSHGGRP